MESDLLTAFVDEAESILSTLRGCIIPAVQGNSAVDLVGPLGLVRSLRSAAVMFPLDEFQNALERLESEVGAAHESRAGLTPATARAVLDLTAELEAIVGDIKITVAEPGFDVGSFVDETFDLLEGLPNNVLAASPGAAPATATYEDEFEIDKEMLEVFAMEAEDLLGNMETNLELLAVQPNNREALWEIRRNAHTYKGAAGIVGLRSQSELAHRVEDLLDRLSDNNSEADREVFELLRTAADCLRAMTSGEKNDRLDVDLSRVFAGFDGLLRTFGTAAAKATPDVSVPDALAESDKGESSAAKADRRSIIRVSLEGLDKLVRTMRDLVISRSVFERRLDDLQQQINELHNSTRRLQSTCSRLELDFEAAMIEDSPVLFDNREMRPRPGPSTRNFDSLEFDRYTEFHQCTRELSETTSDTFSISTALDNVRGNLEGLFDQQKRLIEEMQDHLMKLRMVEFSAVATRLQRTVRVTCEEEGKLAEVAIENGHFEIDTQILDCLIEPLMHLLKNSVVHGIEPPETRRLLGKPESGNIRIDLSSEETHIVVEVSDDGRGIAGESLAEKAMHMGMIDEKTARALSLEDQLQLIFLPGLTTAEKLSMSAGRGVGMSIVRESIEAQRGTINVASTPQRGTTFTLRMPLPLAVTNAVLARANGQTYAVPVRHLKHIGTVPSDAIDIQAPEPTAIFSGQAYSFRCLDAIAGNPSVGPLGAEFVNVLLIESGGNSWAVAVDEVIRSEEVVIESLEKPLDSICGLFGAAILGNGELVPILDIPALLKGPQTRHRPAVVRERAPSETIIMIVDDSPSVRHLTSKVVENAGWKAITAKDGFDALEKLRAARYLPAVILSDVEMPRMDGYEFVTKVRENAALKHIPVIFITSRSGEKHRDKAASAGATKYLIKPFNETELIESIQSFAGRPVNLGSSLVRS
jgi:chemosensory pili system protein ChpA (sensor histidine kinase/response regulator)